MESFMLAKYHISIAKRMFESYETYSEKRMLVGVINETTRSINNLIRSLMVLENVHGNFRVFESKVSKKYLGKTEFDAIKKMVEISNAHSKSPVEFSKDDKIILLVNENYRILTVDRLKFFVEIIDTLLKRLTKICRQV